MCRAHSISFSQRYEGSRAGGTSFYRLFYIIDNLKKKNGAYCVSFIKDDIP